MKVVKRSLTPPRVAASAALVIALCSIVVGCATAATPPRPDKHAETASQDTPLSEGRKSPIGLEFSRR